MILTVTLNTSIDKLYVFKRFEPYAVMRVESVHNTAGGKGLNVSRIAAQAGESVTAMGFVGGFNGRYLESLITEPSIRTAFTRIEGETRSCVNCWDQGAGRSTECLEPGANVREEETARFLEDFRGELPGADVVVLSGSLPKGVPGDLYAALIRLCKLARKPVLLDTSGETLRLSAKAAPTMVKPNADELSQLLGKTVSSLDEMIGAAEALRETGIGRVVVSLGAEGALMVCRDGVLTGKPPRITPVNTVGCGDSMVGGFAVGYARGWDAETALRYAVAVSAANALSMGTGSYDPDDLERLMPQIEINKLR